MKKKRKKKVLYINVLCCIVYAANVTQELQTGIMGITCDHQSCLKIIRGLGCHAFEMDTYGDEHWMNIFNLHIQVILKTPTIFNIMKIRTIQSAGKTTYFCCSGHMVTLHCICVKQKNVQHYLLLLIHVISTETSCMILHLLCGSTWTALGGTLYSKTALQ